MTFIHETAIVSDGATLGDGCEIGPYSVIGPHVVLGPKCRVASHVVIEGNTRLGAENEVFQFASVGSKPQDLKYHGEASELVVGDRNIIREYVTLQPGTEGGGMLTKIGDQNLFMASVHVGHDSFVGDKNIFANSVALSGHVIVGNNVIVGGLSGVHQFARLGDFCFLGAGAMAAQDVPPYCTAHGNRAELIGLNVIGLKRAGWTSEQASTMRKVYREVLHGEGVMKARLASARDKFQDFTQAGLFLDFIAASERGVATARLKRD